MATIEVKDMKGKKASAATLSDAVFKAAPNVPLMHSVVRAEMAGWRQGTHATKTRHFVSGGGRKPYRQKGTGRARQGSIRSPQYAGGGVVFGPHPRSHALKVNRKEIKAAMRSALSAKLADQELMIVDDIAFEKPSTRAAVAFLQALKVEGRVTVVLPDNAVNPYLSFRNLARVHAIAVSDVDVYDLIDNKVLVLTAATAKRLEEVLD
ncbi:MAG: 50S ribosomal protein L4 [Coriobacteriales bacterium]|jgi:large subunit ribosomal protein L4|nr:50S ribosomal protein L4 [Coriobacteriales bacterium]